MIYKPLIKLYSSKTRAGGKMGHLTSSKLQKPALAPFPADLPWPTLELRICFFFSRFMMAEFASVSYCEETRGPLLENDTPNSFILTKKRQPHF